MTEPPANTPDDGRPAVFLDRDGTLSEEVGYVRELESFRLYPWSGPSVRRLNDAGLRVIVVTNQAGVARGFLTEEILARVHDRLVDELAREGARLDAIYYCPHHPEGTVEAYRRECDCRKPKLGMLTSAAREHGIDLASSFVVGDHYRDLELGFRSGARAVLVLTGHGRDEYRMGRETGARPPDHVAETLREATEWIVSRLGR